jgi:hypothetical protein
VSNPLEIKYSSEHRRRFMALGTAAVWLFSREEIGAMTDLEMVLDLLAQTTAMKNAAHRFVADLVVTPDQEFAIRTIDAQTKDLQRASEKLVIQQQ